MAWNGRNVSILGDKPGVKDDAAAPTKNTGDNSKTTSNNQATGDASDAKKKSAPAPAPTLPSVWNGRHQKIITSRDPSKDKDTPGSETSSLASGAPAFFRSPSPAISSISSVSKTMKDLVVISPPKDDLKSVVPKEKEDETTNSTAGSSITKSIDTEDRGAGAALDVKVVTTQVVTATVASSDKKDGKDESSSEETAGASSATESSNNIRSKTHHAKTKSPNNANSVQRRPGSKGGARGNNTNGNNNNRLNYTRGVSNGSARRRANNNNADKPVRSFYTYPPARGTNRNAAPFIPYKRAFDPHKATAIKMAKKAQDNEDRSLFTSNARIDAKIIKFDEKKTEELQGFVSDPPFFSIDVECIATGYGSCAKGINDGCGNVGGDEEGVPAGQYNDGSHRYPGRVAMVDSDGNVLANIIVRPPQEGKGVVSYLTPLTGLTSEQCLGEDAKPLAEVVAIVKGLLSPDAVLVGQAIDHDVEWLGLVPGKDFGKMLDICKIFRQRMPSVLWQAASVLKKKEEDGGPEASTSEDPSSDAHLGFATRYRHFSLRHVCVNLLDEDIQSGVHDPVVDARYSLVLFHKYRNSSVTQLRILRDGLHRAPVTPSFSSEKTPVVDGVCVSAAGYRYKRAARNIWRWYVARKKLILSQWQVEEEES